MSEYQSHDFLALDRPLTAKQLEELRAISTRAEISSTRFRNEYHYGDLKVEPARLVAKYFDAYVYVASWGTRRLMLRIPAASVDAKALRATLPDRACVKAVGSHVIVDLVVDDEEADRDESPPDVDTLAPLRAELMQGDLRAAYLAWLLAVQRADVPETVTEPPVPPGLSELSAAQSALVDFLRLDVDLLAVAAEESGKVTDDRPALRAWARGLSPRAKDAWLQRAIEAPDLALGAELLGAFRAETRTETRTETKAESGRRRRTVAELLAKVDTERGRRERAEAACAAKAARAAEAARSRRLDRLAAQGKEAWRALETLVEESAYDRALELAIDLRDLAARDGEAASFLATFAQLRETHLRRRGFFDRWKRANRQG